MPQTEYKANVSDCVAAMRSVRCAKNVLSLLIVTAVVAVLGGFGLLTFTEHLDGALYAPAPAAGDADQPSAAPAKAQQEAEAWRAPTAAAMTIAKVVAPLAAAVAVVALMLGVLVVLVGRLDGAGGLCSALFWALILLVILVPWQAILPDTGAQGAVYSLEALAPQAEAVVKAAGPAANTQSTVLYYVRYAGYPVVAFLAWLMMQVSFAGGYKRMTASTVVAPAGEPPAA
jgi:hypothetical protein